MTPPEVIARSSASAAAGAQISVTKVPARLAGVPVPGNTEGVAPPPAVAPAEVEHDLRELTRWILHTSDYSRDDRLWPAHFQVFTTNPLNLEFGALGTAVFLHRRGELPPEALEWILARNVDVRLYPPGLLTGSAGVAYGLNEIGLRERAVEVIRETFRSPLLTRDAGLFYGAAGWGLVSLFIWRSTGEADLLSHALEAGEFIARTARETEVGVHWGGESDHEVPLGVESGAAGVALFLLELHRSTGEERWLTLGRRALDHDARSHHETIHGWSWGRYRGDLLSLPYLARGAAGIGSVAIRFFEHTGEKHFHDLAEEAARNCRVKWTVFPGVLNGMAGIGDFLLDLHRIRGSALDLACAWDLADTIRWFRVPTKPGIGFLGEGFSRLCNDYGMGAAGVGMFLHRLVHGGARPLFESTPVRVPC